MNSRIEMGEGRSTKHITSRSPATSPPTYYLARNAAANHRHGWIWTAELVAIYLQLFSRVVTQDECHNKCDAVAVLRNEKVMSKLLKHECLFLTY